MVKCDTKRPSLKCLLNRYVSYASNVLLERKKKAKTMRYLIMVLFLTVFRLFNILLQPLFNSLSAKARKEMQKNFINVTTFFFFIYFIFQTLVAVEWEKRILFLFYFSELRKLHSKTFISWKLYFVCVFVCFAVDDWN